MENNMKLRKAKFLGYEDNSMSPATNHSFANNPTGNKPGTKIRQGMPVPAAQPKWPSETNSQQD